MTANCRHPEKLQTGVEKPERGSRSLESLQRASTAGKGQQSNRTGQPHRKSREEETGKVPKQHHRHSGGKTTQKQQQMLEQSRAKTAMGEGLGSNFVWTLPGIGSEQRWSGCCIPSNRLETCVMLFIAGPLGVIDRS